MAFLLQITLFSILGILQSCSAGYELKNMEVGSSVYEVKCSEKLTALIDAYPKYSAYLKDSADLKYKAIQIMEGIVATRNKCDCGKEIEDKKCLEELISGLQNIINIIHMYSEVYGGPILETVNNITGEASFSLNELSCCCKSDVCVKKLEFPYAVYKDPIRDCKPEKCNSGLSEIIKLSSEYLNRVGTSLLLLEQCTNEYEVLAKAKDEIPKEGKCKEENAASLISKVQNVNLCFTKMITQQLIISEDLNGPTLRFAEEAISQLIQCSKEKMKEKAA